MTTKTYYVDGEFVAADAAVLPLADLSVLRGYGVFDLLRTYDGAPFRLDAHLERLERSAQAIGLTMPWSRAELAELVLETYARNALPNASIRLVVTGNVSASFMLPDRPPLLAIMVDPVQPIAPDVYAAGALAVTTRIPRVMAQVKSLNYIGAIMAMQAAKPLGAVEAIYCNAADELSEGTRCNLFVVRDGVVYTPGEDVLLGITRQGVLDAAAGAVEIVEQPVTLDDLRTADEVFLTSTTKELLPIRQIDDIVIGDGNPGPVTARLTTLFQDLVRREIAEIAVR
ncbi:MAG: aminotransferase class IV [Litorilinea sp.]